MTTFSQLVDDIVKETLRFDMLDTIAAYTNQTLRDVHFKPSLNVPILYDANRYEDTLTVTNDGMWSWPIPSNTRFQAVEAVWFNEPGIYWKPRNPRVALDYSMEPDAFAYYYRSGPIIAFNGVVLGWTGKISYHMFPKPLQYKKLGRLIKYDSDSDTYVLADGSAPTEEQLDSETNWLLMRWADTIKEGVRAKLYKRLGEIERTKLCYSAFENMRATIWNTEPSS